MFKYPRTPHLEGSRLQPGDEDLAQVPFERVRGRHLVVEEKLDGANCGISFTSDGRRRLQSRGHYLTGGPRERQFTLLKSWAATHTEALYQALSDRFVLFGEWLYARHTVFYDALPRYFLEQDFVWNATNISRQQRDMCIGLAAAYHARVEIVALEADPDAFAHGMPGGRAGTSAGGGAFVG